MATETTSIERLTAMNDLQIVRFFEHWGTALCDGADTDLDTITAGIPDEISTTPGFAEVTDLSKSQNLDPRTSARVARAVLLPLAEDPQVEPSIATALETFEDDRLLVDVILALGLVASVLLIVSTTEFDGKIGPITFHKGKADPETIKAVTGGVFGVLKP